MKHTSLFMLFSLLAVLSTAQPADLQSKTDSLQQLLTRADTLLHEQEPDPQTVNRNIGRLLTDILTTADIGKYNLDSLLHHPFLSMVHSPDKRLYLFQWYANNGGTWNIVNHLVYYRFAKASPIVYLRLDDIDITDEETGIQKAKPSSLQDNSGSYDKIYVLTPNIYLLKGYAKGCSTCSAAIFTVIQTDSAELNFEYPAFITEDGPSTSFVIETRYGNLTKFAFDPTTKTIYYSYKTDDRTPVPASGKIKRVTGSLKFNGKRFVANKQNAR